jgi:hypothetical protein
VTWELVLQISVLLVVSTLCVCMVVAETKKGRRP